MISVDQPDWTPEQKRISRQWVVFRAAYPDFCINSDDRFRPKGIFTSRTGQNLTTERAIAARALHDDLIALPDADLEIKWRSVQAEEETKREAAHPINQHVADAETYDFYSKAAYWTAEEGCALLVARNPRKFDLNTVTPYGSISKTARQFLDLHDLVTRASSMLQLSPRSAPRSFLEWAKRNRIPIPKDLATAVEGNGSQVVDWKTMHDQQVERVTELQARNDQLEARSTATSTDLNTIPLDPRERTSLLKIILGLAIAIYGHDPRQVRMTTVSEIRSELDRVGIALSDDTIRKYLREANELAPDTLPESD